MITYTEDPKVFTPVQIIYSDRDMVRALIKSALINQTEAVSDQIIDSQAQNVTRASINESLRAVNPCTKEFLEFAVDKLKADIMREMETMRYGAAVTRIEYNLAGEATEIDLNLSISWD